MSLLTSKLAILKTASKTLAIYICLILTVALVGFMSALFMGKNNPVENAAENFIDQEVESKFHLPSGTVKVDLAPDEK